MVKFDTKQCYGEQGYFTPAALVPYCLKHKICRCTVIGGRSTGKSIGTLMWLLQNDIYFAYSRRHASQVALVSKPALSPLKAVNRNLNTDFMAAKVEKDVWGVYNAEYNADGSLIKKPAGRELGLFVPLSTGAGLRGFDGLDIKVWVYDEIILDGNERPLSDEGQGVRSLYETINRDRENAGEPPLLMLAFGNSNKLASPYAIEFGLVRPLVRMKREGLTILQPTPQDLLILLDDSPRKELKSQQAVYAGGGKYAQMAVDNDFIDDHFSKMRFVSNKQLKPICKVGDLSLAEIKNGGYYITTDNIGGLTKTYACDKIGIEKFKRQHAYIMMMYWLEEITFRDELSESLWQEYLRLG